LGDNIQYIQTETFVCLAKRCARRQDLEIKTVEIDHNILHVSAGKYTVVASIPITAYKNQREICKSRCKRLKNCIGTTLY